MKETSPTLPHPLAGLRCFSRQAFHGLVSAGLLVGWLLAMPLWSLSYEDAEKAYKEKDFSGALSMLRTLAERDDGKAQYSLALMLAKGEGTDVNLVEAFVWATLATENTSDEFYQARSSILLERVEKKLSKEQRAKAGEDLSAKRAKMADKKANPDRVDWETTMMSFKMGNYDEAIADVKKLAEKNEQRALAFLGDIYRRGDGVTADPEEARKWLQQGAGQEFADCQFALGEMYANGEGMTRDDPEAVKLFYQAAEAGFPLAQTRLAEFLSTGRGTDKNLVDSLKWAILAAEQGQTKAEDLMRSLKKLLPEKQAEKAQEDAQKWHEQTGK